MPEQSSYLSPKNFTKMVSEGKNFMPGAVRKELKTAGFGRFLSDQKITKQKAMQAISHLKDKGLIKTSKRVAQIYNPAAQEQYQQDLAADLAIKQKHIQTGIRIDISGDAAAEDRGESGANYDPRSVLGRSRIIDEIRKEQEEKDKQSKKSTGQISGSSRFGRTQNPKTKAPDLTNLPDMGID